MERYSIIDGGLISDPNGAFCRVSDIPSGKVILAAHEAARLLQSDRMLQHLVVNCSYLEDGRIGEKVKPWACWSADDDDRQNMSLLDYLAMRIDGQAVPLSIEAEDDEDGACPYCAGSGEGMYSDSTCHACHGSGQELPKHKRRDYLEELAEAADMLRKERRENAL